MPQGAEGEGRVFRTLVLGHRFDQHANLVSVANPAQDRQRRLPDVGSGIHGPGLKQLERLRVMTIHERDEELLLQACRGLVEFGIEGASQLFAGNLANRGEGGVAEEGLLGPQLLS